MRSPELGLVPMKILVIELSNLGDAILTYPALESLWAAFPDGEFHVLAGPRSADLFAGEPRVRKVWVWRKEGSVLKRLGLIPQLALQKFSWVVDFRRSLIPLFLVGARRARIPRSTSVNGTHRVQQHLSLLTDLGISIREEKSPLPFGPEEERFVGEQLGSDRPVVVMAPGSRSHLKRWPAQRFAAVADRLVEEQQAQIIFVGDQEERPIVDSVLSAMKSPTKDLTGRTSLRQLAALLAKSDLLITNDSACLHAGQVMGTPTVAIFGPTDEKKYGPRNPNSVVVRKQLVCAPCERALCPYGHECMNWLDSDEVFSAAVKILRGDTAVHAEPFGSVRPEPVEGRTGQGR
ncbi:MAG: glycosyltransferase family 9 protein [Candidatus Omnitrophica bacterium]|nr:glycosyltransferase family 9 protein [Candidatus Omnitrophota bacterium]